MLQPQLGCFQAGDSGARARAAAARRRRRQAGCRLAAGWLQAGCILFLAIFACGRFAIHQTGLLYSWIVLRVSR
jgi:hypothetical protein